MQYFKTKLCFAKKPLRFKPFVESDPFRTDRIEMETVTIVYDPEYMIGLLDSVHSQITKIRRIGLTPKSVCMNLKTYEQMVLYNFNVTGKQETAILFGLIPIVSVQFENYQIEVQCDAFDEFIYREELSKLRYKTEE
jgi:hypothetical protein